MQSSRKKIIWLVLFLAIIFAGVYYYRQYGGSLIQVASVVTEQGTPPVGEDLLVLVQKIDYINIDNSVLASAVFTSLKDTSVSILQEEKSKPDPFAPLTLTVQGSSSLSPTTNGAVKNIVPPKR